MFWRILCILFRYHSYISHRFLVCPRVNVCACVWFSSREIVHVRRFSYCNWLILATWITWNTIHFIALNEKTVETHLSGVVFNIDLYNSIWTKSSQNKFSWTWCCTMYMCLTDDDHWFSFQQFQSLIIWLSGMCACMLYFFFSIL